MFVQFVGLYLRLSAGDLKRSGFLGPEQAQEVPVRNGAPPPSIFATYHSLDALDNHRALRLVRMMTF